LLAAASRLILAGAALRWRRSGNAALAA